MSARKRTAILAKDETSIYISVVFIEKREIVLNIAVILGEKAVFCFYERSNPLHYTEELAVTVC
ncbi:MAG: hypothetical protein HWQ43_16650 [Nostoc sp. JL31]|uniref:hypothetical protein n=1 Tax=Nostoc sp. JL31 TaxID=2815395 RepID=UPI0025EFD547|nr:hypothetical protein [Nostoc sp. JL31]MBN3890717.1 hypothetical protein [Nostoc sp. JL31]